MYSQTMDYQLPCEFFRIDFYRIYRIYRICRILFLIILKIKIKENNIPYILWNCRILCLVICKISITENIILQVLDILWIL